jgi:hypothetical protein
MPNIPRYQRSVLPPGSSGGVPMSPGAASAVGQGLSSVGGGIQGLGANFAKVQAYEQQAEDAIEATKLESALRNASLGIMESFKSRTDYTKFDDDIESTLQDLRDNLSPSDGSPALQRAFEKAFEQQAFSIRSAVKAKKYNVMDEQGKIAFGDIYQQALQDWSTEKDPTKREIIKNELFMKGAQLQQSNAVSPLWIEQQLDSFDKNAEAFANAESDVAADQLIMENPEQAVELLANKAFLPDLDQKVRQDKIEKATRAVKIQKKEAESKLKEQEKEQHTQEERKIGDLYTGGNYTQAFVAVQTSGILNGPEKKSWADAINKKLNGEDVPSSVQASEIVKINGMISSGEDPEKIRNSIIRSPYIDKEDKEQYINRLETKLASEEDYARKTALKRIKDNIIPKRSLLSALAETPSETRAVADAQDALFSWMDSKKSEGKYLTYDEIMAKAEGLSNAYQVPIATKLEEIESATKEVAEGSKEFSQQKVEYQKIPETDRSAIERELKRLSLPVTMKNVIKVYKDNGSE